MISERMLRLIPLTTKIFASRFCRCWNIALPVAIVLSFALLIDGFTIQRPRVILIQPTRLTTAMTRHNENDCNLYFKYHGKSAQRRTSNLYSDKNDNSDRDEDSKKEIHYNDFEDEGFTFSVLESDTKTEPYIWNQIRMRQQNLIIERIQRSKNIIKSGECTSNIGVAISNDWIRRISIHTYPYAILGTSTDHIYLADIETGKLWGTSKKSKRDNDWSQSILSQRLQYVTQQMFGLYDGGGTLAVATYHSLLFEATRNGNVNIYRFRLNDLSSQSNIKSISDGGTGIELFSMGNFPSLKGCLVTSLHCSDDNYIWIGTDAGRVEVYKMQHDMDQGDWVVANKQNPFCIYQTGTSRTSIVLSIHVNSSLKCAVVTTNTGSIELLYYGEERNDTSHICTPICSFTPPLGDTMQRRAVNAYPTTATIIEVSKNITAVANDDNIPPCVAPIFAVVSGTNDGKIYLQELRTDEVGRNDKREPQQIHPMINIRQPLVNTCKPIQPYHFEWVKCIITMGSDGLLLTGALDGTIRLWDVESSRRPDDVSNTNENNGENLSMKMIYQLMGYKVWLGSIWTDGRRIASDGADNAIIVHDFSAALDSRTSSSIRSKNRFNDSNEDPFDIDDDRRNPPTSPRVDGDFPDKYPNI